MRSTDVGDSASSMLPKNEQLQNLNIFVNKCRLMPELCTNLLFDRDWLSGIEENGRCVREGDTHLTEKKTGSGCYLLTLLKQRRP